MTRLALVVFFLATVLLQNPARCQDSEKPTADTPSVQQTKPKTDKSDSKPANNRRKNPDTDSDAKNGLKNAKQNKQRSGKSSAKNKTKSLVIPLPRQLSDERGFLPIGIYQSQLSVAVPNDYRVVSLDRLQAALDKKHLIAKTGQSVRIKKAFYDVQLIGQSLFSDRSVIDLEKDTTDIVRGSLGEVNLAMSASKNRFVFPIDLPSVKSQPRFESSDSGELFAVFPGQNKNASVHFGWSLQGELNGIYRDFQLALPLSPQTQIVISTPPDTVLTSDDGVLRSWPSPPPGADTESRRPDVRWYTIEAGGLSTRASNGLSIINLHARQEQDLSSTSVFAVRYESRDYAIDSSGVNWRHVMRVQSQGGRRIPELELGAGIVTSIRIANSNLNAIGFGQGVNRRFKTTSQADGSTIIRINEPLFGDASEDIVATISIVGKSTWDGDTGWCDLPTTKWIDRDVIDAHPSCKTKVTIVKPLSVVAWELPDQWVEEVVDEADTLDAGLVVLQSEGPPLSHFQDDLTEDVVGKRAWSRMRLMDESPITSSAHLLQIQVRDDRTMQAKSKLQLVVDPDRAGPIALQVEPNWNLQSVTLVNSGRVIESPAMDQTRTLRIWPESGDVVGRSLVIETRGTRDLQIANDRTDVPATRFLQVKGIQCDTLAAVIPSADLNWAGDTALRGERLDSDSLSDDQIVFFDAFNEESLLFRADANATPSLSLQPPGVSVDVATSLSFERDGDEVLETLVISTQSANQLLKTIGVATGPAQSRPDYRWSLRSDDESLPINLPSTAILLQDDGVYSVTIGESSMRNRRLVGSRRYTIENEITVQCPSVPKAASQDAQIILGPGLHLNHRDTSIVQLVPIETAANDATESGNGGMRLTPATKKTENRSIGDPIRLRYDATKQPELVIQKTDLDPSPGIVWQHELDLTASSRGTDLIRGFFRVSSTRPIQIEYEPDLQLASLSHNSEMIDLNTITQNQIVLTPKADTDVIRVLWTRSQQQNSWTRRCQIPEIEMQGVRLKSSFQLTPSVDTFAIASLLNTSSHASFGSNAIDVVAGTAMTLAPRNLAISFGWLIAAVLFIVGWCVARRSLLVIAIAITLACFAAVLWWPWQLAIVGWCIMPMLAAALLQSSIDWLKPTGNRDADHDANENPVAGDENPSKEFSLVGKAFLGGLIFLCVSASASIAAGQELGAKWINVLVPTNKDFKHVGDKVYIPGSFYKELFDAARDDVPSPVMFESAIYRVDLESARESIADGRNPRIEAEFLVTPTNATNRIQLPFPKSVVERIELKEGEQERIFLAEADTENTCVVSLPPGDAFRLQVTLLPQVVTLNESRTMRLEVPKVASARVLVEADRSIESVNVVGSQGAVTKQPGLRRWEAELGPVGRLQLNYQEAGEEQDAKQSRLERRYLINAGKNRTSIDCQVEPSQQTKVGDVVQLVVLDSAMPTVTSAQWRLERSEMITASRRLLTLVRRSENSSGAKAPIHLFWSVPTVISDSSLDDSSLPITIPDVIPPASGDYEPAWIAIQHGEQIQITTPNDELLDDLPLARFRSAWNGVPIQGVIRQSFLCVEDLPSFYLSQVSADQPKMDSTTHHLQVMNDHMRLQFKATIHSNESKVRRNRLRIPKDMDLVRIKLNGQPVNRTVLSSDDFNEIPLGDFSGSESVTVETLGVMPLPKSRVLKLPGIQVSATSTVGTVYTLTHSEDVQLRIVNQPTDAAVVTFADEASEMLATGKIPKASWRFDESVSDPVVDTFGGAIRVQRTNVKLRCNQSVKMNYQDGDWRMRTEIRFRNRQMSDFVDIEIPTRWCKDLEVWPTIDWTQQQSTDPDRQVIRIACDPTSLQTKPLVLTSELDTSDQGRVDAPRIRVLGAEAKVEVTVPNRLTNSPIEWIAKAVSATNKKSDPLFSTYQVQDVFAWSMELAPLSDAKTDPVALASDSQVFLQDNKTLLICRWDIVPNRLKSVVVRLPDEATCLGAWAAGKPMRFQTLTAEDAGSIRIPLSLSRLAQSVEVMISVPTLNAKRADYLPELREILVPEQWVSVYTPSASAFVEQNMRSRMSKEGYAASRRRGIAMACVVVQSIDQSLDTLAERPANEVATWLLPWIARYRNIASSANHTFRLQDGSDEDSEMEYPVGDPDRVNVLAELSRLSGDNTKLHARLWRILDRRLRAHVDRFLDVGHTDQLADFEPLFDAGNYDGYQLSDVTKITPVVSPRPIQSMSASMHDLRQILINILTLAMVAGTLVIFKPVRNLLRWLSPHPSFWLALIGGFGLLVSPIPVAIAVIVVAMTLPWWTHETTTA